MLVKDVFAETDNEAWLVETTDRLVSEDAACDCVLTIVVELSAVDTLEYV